MSTAQNCPTCQTPFFKGTDYCTDCGEKLRWVEGGTPATPTSSAQGSGSLDQPFAMPRSISPAPRTSAGPTDVVVTDIHMSFGSMVLFMVKWALAAIPALLILMVFAAIAARLLSGMLAGLFRAIG